MNTQLQKVMKPSVLVPLATGIGTFIGGLAVGYMLGRRKQEVVYVPNEIEMAKINADLEEIKARREARQNEPKFTGFETILDQPTGDGRVRKPEVTVEEHIRRKLEDRPEPPEEPAVIAHNVFAASGDDWDYEVEKSNRDSTEPYIIHVDEFGSNELGYDQMTLTYYHGDDTLILESEPMKPLYNRHELTGDNLKFGHGSGSDITVYIRNEKRQEEYEVILDMGLYSVEILNLGPDSDDNPGANLQHGVSPRRFRPEE